MSAPPVPVSANRGDAPRPREPSTLYKLIMTPLLFTTFLISLALVDLRHSALRAHYHADNNNNNADGTSGASRLPPWLHRIIYRYRPYRYGVGDAAGRPASPGDSGDSGKGGDGDGEGYYHSKQRELMRMEAEEAFEMRGVVVVVLGLVSVAVGWAVWKVVWWGLGVVGGLVL
ncbi:hypothetical protein B0I37DRAFT_178725 [Chaetomium sp. MPI-CAGE-AT-0009]|nr:hypothetical protein B0I37DRAFT_178725 [Chaetomium sp. MPI-CAGE-AT-0009]